MTNQVFLTNTAEGIRNAFMMMTLAADSFPPNVGALYEEWSAAGPRSLNGYPMFFSCRMVPAESMQALGEEIERMRAALGMPPLFSGPQEAPGAENGVHEQ